MVSDAARKKWGTIFMGNREATMEQLDAMQEPVLRERVQKDQEKSYLERVRQRAADRAREILEEAYTERQKILQDAQSEAEVVKHEQIAEAAKTRNEAQKIREAAQKELERARTLRQEAETIRDQAHGEGYSAGMEQASQELREFRADMGNEMAQVMRAVEKQTSVITGYWREDLAELVRQAVQTSTGWVLENAHREIITSLVMKAVHLLEDRTVVTLKVNPDDEAIVGDLFCAARERAPELRQWIVQGDAGIERGGIYAESSSGSVDLRRENFRNLVSGILEHLTVPATEEEKRSARELHEQIEAKAGQMEADAAAASSPSGGLPQETPQDVSVPAEPGAEQGEPESVSRSAPAAQAQEPADPLRAPTLRDPRGGGERHDVQTPADPGTAVSRSVPQDQSQDMSGNMSRQDASQDLSEDPGAVSPHAALERELIPDELLTGDLELPDDIFQLDTDGTTPPAGTPAEAVPGTPVPDASQAGTLQDAQAGTTRLPEESRAEPGPDRTDIPGEDVGEDSREETREDTRDPNSLAFLEEELFPVGDDAESDVLANGGFLPETERQ